MANIRFKRGPKDRLPKSAGLGEPIFTTDTNEFFIGTGPNVPVVKIGAQTKDINIICSMPSTGVHDQYAKLPYSGNIQAVDAYCGIASSAVTEIDIEKISEEDFDSGLDSWTSIFTSNVTIQPDKSSHDKTYEIDNKEVNKNDLFRLVFVQVEDIERLTVQIQIAIDN